jgi:lipid A oxidase
MRNTVTLLALLFVLAIQPARAETNLSIYIGKSFTDDSDLRLRQPNGTQLTFHGVPWSDHSFEMPIYYGGRVTHFFKRRPDWGVALDFFHYKVFSDINAVLPVTGTRSGAPVSGSERLGDTIQKFNISHGVNYLTLNAVHRWRLRPDASRYPNGRLQPYVGAGLGAVIPHVEATIGGRTIGKYQWRGPGFQLFGGVSYGLSSRWSLFGEYKYTHTTLTVDIPNGDAHTTLDTHHLVLGGSYRL